MSRRDVDDMAFGAVVWMGIVAAGVAAFLAATIEVSVPLLWPLASTIGCAWAALAEVERCLTRRYEAQRAAEIEERAALEDAPPKRLVAEVLQDYRRHVRIGDAERDVIVSALHTHFGAGRLDRAELDERLALALAAKTGEDLRTAVLDLPSEWTGR